MFKLFLNLFFQFFQIGVFSFGGGYATLPFLYAIGENFHWYTPAQLTNMLAVSSVTPGPVGINVATYAGYTTSGILGAFIATGAIILPSLIISTVVFKILDKFKSNSIVQGAVKALKSAGCALLSAVGIKLLFTSNLHLIGTMFFVLLIILSFKKKSDPIFYLGLSALFGLIFGHFNLIGV